MAQLVGNSAGQRSGIHIAIGTGGCHHKPKLTVKGHVALQATIGLGYQKQVGGLGVYAAQCWRGLVVRDKYFLLFTTYSSCASLKIPLK